MLSNGRSFDRFKALKEFYLPETGLWLCDYPYVDRREFAALSVAVDAERREEEAAAAAGVGGSGVP